MRTALRRLARTPLFAFGAVATLGLGLGAAAAVVQVVDALYLRALPLPAPDRLVRLYVTPPGKSSTLSLRPETFAALRTQTGALFDLVVGQRLTEKTVQGADGAEQVDAIGVTAGWAELVGQRPQLGRLFTADEHEAGEASDAIALGDGAWRTLFGADPGVLGRKVVIDGVAKSVVGVLPRGFAYPYGADVWHPTRPDRPSSSPWSFNAPARLRAGVTLAQANAALAALVPRIQDVVPPGQRDFVPYAKPLREILLDDRDRGPKTALVVVALLLALVAANLAALFHARWLAARRELALRAALGGGRGAIARALAAEGVAVAAGGLGLGLALARLARPLLARQVPTPLLEVGTAVELTLRAGLLSFALAAAILLATAVLPAWRAARVDPFQLLRGDGGAGGARDVRRATRLFVALQVGLALALGATSVALAFDLRARAALDLGYDADRVAMVDASLSAASYADPAARLRFAERAVEAFGALPGVERSAVVHLPPSDRGSWLALLERPDVATAAEDRFQVQNRVASPELLAAMGLRLLDGRWLDAADRAGGAPVAVISETVARRFFPDGGAVGRRLRNTRSAPAGGAPALDVEIVGVVADVHEFAPSNAAWYRPLAQTVDTPETALLCFVVRTAPGAAPPSYKSLRDAVAGLDPRVALFDYAPARELLLETVTGQRDAAGASAFLALFGLALAALGLFVRVAEAVARRRRELGVRLALGATHHALVRSLVAEGSRLALLGLAPGALGALALQRLLARQLEAPALASDLRPLLVALAVTAGSILLAAWLAGRRATGVDPARELRAE